MYWGWPRPAAWRCSCRADLWSPTAPEKVLAGSRARVSEGSAGVKMWRSMKAAAVAQAGVEVEGGDDGLEGVREQGGFGAAAAALLALAEAEAGAEVEAEGHLAEVAAADDGGAEAGELALAGVGEAAVEGLGDDQAEDGVAEELELLVVGARVGEALGVGLVGERAVGEGELEQRGVLEGVAENGGQVERGLGLGGGFAAPLGCFCFHVCATPPGSTVTDWVSGWDGTCTPSPGEVPKSR